METLSGHITFAAMVNRDLERSQWMATVLGVGDFGTAGH